LAIDKLRLTLFSLFFCADVVVLLVPVVVKAVRPAPLILHRLFVLDRHFPVLVLVLVLFDNVVQLETCVVTLEVVALALVVAARVVVIPVVRYSGHGHEFSRQKFE
jgi:hypothetical protein